LNSSEPAGTIEAIFPAGVFNDFFGDLDTSRLHLQSQHIVTFN